MAQDDLAGPREMLSSRYDDIRSGKVKLMHGGEVFARLREKSGSQVNLFHGKRLPKEPFPDSKLT